MCDPVFEDCPVEKPSGPSLEDLLKAGEFRATDFEVFEANMKVMLAVLAVIVS